ncbi:cysteine--tRNA ligase [Sulfitobacter mediterraneus]|uniref:cysteine--tRNA ligase n=1 Tax=Sulfitobacter mediterraneus TaxID=83219 RepID=UPI0019395D19|nr:cysteine--tRNA ligase [Sulfitobacter mediterraneus]MBM1557189.1 cysteine--tRNA ligase [Sulfitobacter mediterraneus]MBM1568235.1 cysteine--tRNA ligase [Sulfitobacter mediterraneus]MBM1572162.1 cysteine--tRNA ligase [Sulfitobacter mediterraneus]MBM1575951.1 cysteine--tRNA ligase [Sulfitobacter mediterraneus]MBM1580273.1 cysteine--tRNA ligase [Sulfitobacter mediterraneus]
MTTIKLHNTKTRTKEDFVPINPDDVRMYVCGPTVYDRAHIGNARPVIVFDVLYRLLRHVYGADHVTYVRNFTDVDDKINARAASAGRPISEITAETTQWFLDDMAAVGALQPSIKGAAHQKAMPRATAYIAEMVAMTEDLIAKGHAYEAEGHVLFRVRSYENYGSLSGRSVDDMIAGARVEVAPYKEDPMDFVLWKPSDADTPGWDSPWGKGRPGWHIECSAMAEALLGSEFDIHGGGNDLTFPHHENEIAQSKCAGHGFARYWMHNEMLQVEGKKMSKSLGNFFTVRDLLDQGVPGEVIRFVMLSTHYRKPMDWTEKKRVEAEKTLRKWYALTASIEASTVDEEFLSYLGDDLNTSAAITYLHWLSNDPSFDQSMHRRLLANARMIGLLLPENSDWASQAKTETNVDQKIRNLMSHRWQARKLGLWAEADAIRDGLKAAGIQVREAKDGSYEVDFLDDFDPEKLEILE